MPDKISCPNCSHEFDVEEALAGKIEAHFKKEFEQKLAEQSKRFSNERAELEKEREAFKQAKERENELFVEKLNQKLEQEKKKEILENTVRNISEPLNVNAANGEKIYLIYQYFTPNTQKRLEEMQICMKKNVQNKHNGVSFGKNF